MNSHYLYVIVSANLTTTTHAPPQDSRLNLRTYPDAQDIRESMFEKQQNCCK